MNNRFIHRYLAATSAESRTLLLLHGTGGNENDLIPLGQAVLPGAAILSVRGRILENGMPRFFRRFQEGVFDLDNLREEAAALDQFLSTARSEYGIESSKLFAVGFSNGANMGHSLLSLHPESLAGGAFIRAMTTFPNNQLAGLEGKQVFLSSGRADSMVPVEDADYLAKQLQSGGATVEHYWTDAGHNLTRPEITAIAEWFASLA